MTLVGKRQIPLIFLAFYFFTACDNLDDGNNSNYLECSGYAQGTTFSIIYDDDSLRDFSIEFDSILNAFDSELSLYIDSSDISKFNNGSAHFYLGNKSSYIKNCFQKAKDVYNVTNGLFNPAIFPLVNYWGFYNDKLNIDSIDDHVIDSLLKLISFSDSAFCLVNDTLSNDDELKQIEPFFYKVNPDAMLDFNGIAQGLSVDVIANYLLSKGLDNYMVEIGGEVRVSGLNPSGDLWKIGVDRPVENSSPGENEFQLIVGLSDNALATSGNYRKFYKKNGVKYSHTINPVSGYPVDHSLLSVTVISNDAASADAFATAFMVMGVDKSLVFISEHPELKLVAYFVYDENGNNLSVQSKGMSDFILN